MYREHVERATPDGDYAALGARVIAQSECGNYGEDALTAWKLPDGVVVIERVGKDGRSRRWPVEATDTLRVTAEAWGNLTMVGADTFLILVALEGEEIEISHFEINLSWGGVTDDEVAELARKIAIEAGCTVTVVPIKFADPPAVRNDETAAPKQVPAAAPITAAPPKALLGDRAGSVLLASLLCGDDNNEQLRAIKLSDNTVVIENATTGAHWLIASDDVLVITPYAVVGGPGGVWTCLERATGKDRIAGFYCWEDDRKGADEAAVAAFVAKVVAAAACKVDHRAMIWD